MNPLVELRAHTRVHLEIEIDLESDHNFYSGITGDISEGGIFVGTYAPPPLGECLTLDLKLPGCATTFQLSGVVRWLRELRVPNKDAPPGFGLAWKDISADALAAIRSFVAERDTILFDAA